MAPQPEPSTTTRGLAGATATPVGAGAVAVARVHSRCRATRREAGRAAAAGAPPTHSIAQRRGARNAQQRAGTRAGVASQAPR